MFVIRGGPKMKALTVMCNQTELFLFGGGGGVGRLKANYHTAGLPLGGVCYILTLEHTSNPQSAASVPVNV